MSLVSNTLKFHLITEELHPNVLPNVLLYSQNISYLIALIIFLISVWDFFFFFWKYHLNISLLNQGRWALSLVVYITGLILYLPSTTEELWDQCELWVIRIDTGYRPRIARPCFSHSSVCNTDRKSQRQLNVYMSTGEQLTDFVLILRRKLQPPWQMCQSGRQDMNIDSWSFTKRKLWQFSIFLCLRLKVQLHFTIFWFKMERSGTALYLLWQMSQDLTWQHMTIPHKHKRAHTRTSVCC